MATQLLMAKSPEEAIGAKNASAVFIAGGTEVNRLGSDAAAAADTLISLKKCAGLHDIVADGDKIRIDATYFYEDGGLQEAVMNIGMQLFWAAALWLLTKVLFGLAIRKVSINGG